MGRKHRRSEEKAKKRPRSLARGKTDGCFAFTELLTGVLLRLEHLFPWWMIGLVRSSSPMA